MGFSPSQHLQVDFTQSQKASLGLHVIICKMGTTVSKTAPIWGLLTVCQVQTEHLHMSAPVISCGAGHEGS